MSMRYLFKYIIFSAFALLLPLLIFELSLRLLNFQYIPVSDEFKITDEYRIFEKQDQRYVTKEQKTASFNAQIFPCNKSNNEFRIFLMGGSSINNLQMAQHLRLKLIEQYPELNLLIVNCGGNAYGTTRLLLHFQEIVEYQPDLVILYSGHNEFNEQYMRDSYFKDNVWNKLNNILFRTFKTYQLYSYLVNEFLKSNIEIIKNKKHPFFPPDFELQWDKVYDKSEIYQNYRNNIIQMIRLARRYNIKILISTVAYNRLDPPVQGNDTLFETCMDYYNRENYKRALKCFNKVLDEDMQPHRATETSNNIVKEIAKRYNVPFVDVDRIIVEQSKNGIPGWELFDDHCHLNNKGNMLLQEAFFEAIRDQGMIQ